jgi:hypothetical protein
VGSYTLNLILSLVKIRRKEGKMPFKLSTTIGKIQNIPNSKNIEIINEFLEYMRNSSSSEHHQNNNLKVCNNI